LRVLAGGRLDPIARSITTLRARRHRHWF
jgi:hypothetical protein